MRDETLRSRRALIASALELIESDLDGDLGLQALAARAGVSPYHFHRLFSSLVGEPPASYVRRLRLERAALLLKHSRHPITDLAFQAGYDSHEAFSRAFKSSFGVSPRRFRAQQYPLENDLEIQARIVRVEPRRMACVRHVGPYDDTYEAFRKVLAWAKPRGLHSHTHLLALYRDDQSITPPERQRCEVGVPVDDRAVGEGEVGIRCLPGGDYAVIHHRGPADERRRLYDLLYARWIPARGRRPAHTPPVEVYTTRRDGVATVDDATVVYVHLAPDRAE